MKDEATCQPLSGMRILRMSSATAIVAVPRGKMPLALLTGETPVPLAGIVWPLGGIAP